MVTRTQRMIEKKRRWYYLKNNLLSLYATFRLARNPQATKYVFMIGDTQDNIVESERLLGRYPDPFKSSALEALWQSRYSAKRYDLDELMKLPPHTLGGAYARHMKQNELSVDYYQEKAPRNRMQFMRQRMRQTHDVWHVLTGFGTDEFEEVGIQGFYAGQFVSSMSGLIGAGAFFKSIMRCRFSELQKHMDSFCEGYCAGKRAENLLAVKWEELWSESLDSLRRRYLIAPRLRDVTPVRELKAAA
jgi:ubiquinone biosynthesis protein COQ4